MRFLLALSCFLAVVPPALAGPPPEDMIDADVEIEDWTDTTPQPRAAALFKDTMLREHNDVRRDYGVTALVWDENLAAGAAAYARTLATTQRFVHAARLAGRPIEGENLWMGTRGAYAYRDMTASWIEEGKDFVSGTFPHLSRTGSWHDVGHFTQMIWGGTRSVGCGNSANDEDEVLVCRYFPAGNVWGENPVGRHRTEATSLANASAR